MISIDKDARKRIGSLSAVEKFDFEVALQEVIDEMGGEDVTYSSIRDGLKSGSIKW